MARLSQLELPSHAPPDSASGFFAYDYGCVGGDVGGM